MNGHTATIRYIPSSWSCFLLKKERRKRNFRSVLMKSSCKTWNLNKEWTHKKLKIAKSKHKMEREQWFTTIKTAVLQSDMSKSGIPTTKGRVRRKVSQSRQTKRQQLKSLHWHCWLLRGKKGCATSAWQILNRDN